MYNWLNKQYIFRQTSGRVLNIFYENRRGLCLSSLTKRNTWTESVLLVKNSHECFHADMDEEDRIHILSQDNNGNIVYSQLEDDPLKSFPVLNSKSPTPYNKHLRLIPYKSNLHFFYVLRHNNSLMLAHQALAAGEKTDVAPTPRIIDYVADNGYPYTAICDKAGNIYAFYRSSDEKHLQTGYRKYMPQQKLWDEFTPVSRHAADCEFIRAITDSSNIMHICCQRKTNRHYEMIYQQKIPDRDIWTEEIIIHASSYPFDNSSIISINKDIIIYWVRDDIIYFSMSNDSGKTWSKPARYNFPAGRQLMCMSYKTNRLPEKEKISVADIPGCFINGLRFAFYNEEPEGTANLSAAELKNMIIDSLKMLKGSVEELQESIAGIKEDMLKLDSSCHLLEKEVIKYSVKLNLMENELNELKKLNKKLPQ